MTPIATPPAGPPSPSRRVADAEAAQVALHAAVGVGDHAQRQAERGHGPQAVHHPETDVRPAVPPDPLGHLGGERSAWSAATPQAAM